ncbi:RNA recognition motif domain [Dillenia turbinata]|uniref:RNA recognition motif domain n=1 Tax=Dillenia turbinata TaxID=194707 RepID=A0AAN8VRG6_9MAGN
MQAACTESSTPTLLQILTIVNSQVKKATLKLTRQWMLGEWMGHLFLKTLLGDSRGFGFLSLETDEDADAAIRALDKTEWNGRIVLVEKAENLGPDEVGGSNIDKAPDEKYKQVHYCQQNDYKMMLLKGPMCIKTICYNSKNYPVRGIRHGIIRFRMVQNRVQMQANQNFNMPTVPPEVGGLRALSERESESEREREREKDGCGIIPGLI